MNENQLAALLASLTGQLHTDNKEEEIQIEQLQQSIAQSLLKQDPATISSQTFLFEKSDLFISANVKEGRLRKIKEIAASVLANKSDEQLQVFVRNVPIRTTQLQGSASLANAGTRVTTVGPIADLQGRLQWFDFVKVKKLIAIYQQGESLPCLLFDATFNKPRFQLANAKPIELTKTFTLIPESIWIQANILAPTAPSNQYAGLRIKGGTITLDTDPFMEGDKLMISQACKVVCDIQCDQNNSFGSDPISQYGKDAREAKFDLPATFKFSFTGNTKNILSVADAQWKVYGQDSHFKYVGNQNCIYNPAIHRLAIPVDCQHSNFSVLTSLSPFFELSGTAKIVNSWWALPVTNIDVNNPLEADGNGALIIECLSGLTAQWTNLENKPMSLVHPFILGEPGRIGITDLESDGLGAYQNFEGWDYSKTNVENEDVAPIYKTEFHVQFKKTVAFIFNTVAKGDEVIFGASDWHIKADRPVKVNGEAVTIKSKGSGFILAASAKKRLLMVVDQDILWDHKLPNDKIPKVKPIALAMHNALFTTTPVNSLIVFAEVKEDWKKLTKGSMYLGFGLFSYLPTLPDPYAANLGILKKQFEQKNRTDLPATVSMNTRSSQVWLWLIGLVKWEEKEEDIDKVGVSFHFAPLAAPLNIEKDAGKKKPQAERIDEEHRVVNPTVFSHFSNDAEAVDRASVTGFVNDNPTLHATRVNPLARLNVTDFSLLDVSSKANQMGISYAKQNNFLQELITRKYDVNIQDDENATIFPIQVNGLDVVTAGMHAQAFTVPSIAWEPVFNLTPPKAILAGEKDEDGIPLPPVRPNDPPIGFNYYQNDGVATRIGNLSKKNVTLSPIPMAKFLVESYKEKEDGKTFALFNLPFGMVALTFLNNNSVQHTKPSIDNPKPIFDEYINGALQLELTAGTSFDKEADSNMFEGYTFQLVNINNASGVDANASTLAGTPTVIFNNEFSTNSSGLTTRPGVPLTHIGLSGYGASTFSNWQNKEALFAQTSQAQFNVITGRTSHEVVQVKSMLYPWGIRVVRTITIFRLANGYVARVDSGWKAESDGKYDFRWNKPKIAADGVTVEGKIPQPNPFNFYPGIVRGLFNVRNIQELSKVYGTSIPMLNAVTFDADIELEYITEGGTNNRVASTGVLAYVQLTPAARPIEKEDLVDLLNFENNSIGGSISCTIKLADSKQRMRIHRFDMSAGLDNIGNPIFVCAARGSVVLPKDGSWTMVQHSRKTGEVTPLPEQLSVPVIRQGLWKPDIVVDTINENNLLRIAHPADLVKAFDDETMHFGFLQNMGTQKVLFMTPAFQKGVDALLSQTPPLLADSFRLLNSKGIFPNIGDIETNFGQVISILKGADANGNAVAEAFKNKVLGAAEGNINKVFEVLALDVKEEAGKVLDQGFSLAKKSINGLADKALKFDLPSGGYDLINVKDQLIIRLEYKANGNTEDNQAKKDYVGKFDFDIESFAGDLADTWKGRMNNLSVVVSIGPLKEVMTIKGNFNSQKGKEVDLGSKNASDGDSSLPKPEISFSDALQPVVDILELLSSLSSGDYGAALSKGLKVAMSNSANIWEYKFEANKEIPLVRFPPTKELYESPQTPLKLEASLGIGVFFNAALKVTTDPKQLLPTAGAYFKFHGGLQVMCFSVGAGSIYAVGHVDLKLEADSSPKIAVTLKFGFGVQLSVGLPVVGNVSVLFMVGLEVYADSTGVVIVTAFMLFKGRAELLGGLVSVTITIEASGSVKRLPGGDANAIAKVTFAIDISIFLIIDISFSKSWEEERQIA